LIGAVLPLWKLIGLACCSRMIAFSRIRCHVPGRLVVPEIQPQGSATASEHVYLIPGRIRERLKHFKVWREWRPMKARYTGKLCGGIKLLELDEMVRAVIY
jgi:hypothetical protein